MSGFVTRTGNLVSDKSNSELIRTKLDEEFLLELAAIQKRITLIYPQTLRVLTTYFKKLTP